ncbi:MAG: metal-dependent hydrolase [Chloroflexota bacterium]
MAIKVTSHGHATFSLDVDGKKIVVDPFFDGNPAAQVAAADVEADYILITHGHGDHIADALPIAKRTGAKIIANFEIGQWFLGQGYENVHQQHIGGGFQHEFGHIKLTIAFHGSMLPDGSNGGMPNGFLLAIGDKKIYIAGDTAVFSDMSLIGAGGLDLAILPIGDNFTMGPNDAIQAINFLKSKNVIPCHYNTWPPIAVDVDSWKAKAKAETAANIVILSSEQVYEL